MIPICPRFSFLHFLFPFVISIIQITSRLPVLSQPVYDGFNVYCTGNRDGTGLCVNMETSQALDCIIIPGQVIDCKTSSGKSFQCVFYQQYTSNQAEFTCDPAVDKMIREESPSDFKDDFINPFVNPL